MDDSLFLLLALLFLGGMVFFSSRKRKKAAAELKTQVVKGAYVMLTSGIYGKILSIDDNRVELETAPGQKLTVALGAVRSVEEEPVKKAPKAASKTEAKSPAKSSAATVKKSAASASKPASDKK
jgi:preprotein translocase subunit YajC